MKITKPSEMKSEISKLEEDVTKFKEELKNDNKDENYYHLIINNEYNRAVYDKIKEWWDEYYL